MSKDNLGLGKLIVGPEQRDAVHIAVAPVVADRRLFPGQPIGFVEGSNERVHGSNTPIGIVDPFLTENVQIDQQFWMFLYPNTITSLRHDWTHPAFTAEASPSKQSAGSWLHEFAGKYRMDYDEVLAFGRNINGEGLCFPLETLRDDLTEDRQERHRLFDNLEIVTGVKISAQDREEAWFSCAC